MKIIATTIAVLALSPVVAASARSSNYDHEGCQTHRCDHRMDRKEHGKTLHKWWKATQPYRGWLRSVRMCESHGNYRTNTGNSFYGAYQFTLSSWFGAGGRGMPHNAEPLEQDYRAVRWASIIGWGNVHSPAGWPVCG